MPWLFQSKQDGARPSAPTRFFPNNRTKVDQPADDPQRGRPDQPVRDLPSSRAVYKSMSHINSAPAKAGRPTPPPPPTMDQTLAPMYRRQRALEQDQQRGGRRSTSPQPGPRPFEVAPAGQRALGSAYGADYVPSTTMDALMMRQPTIVGSSTSRRSSFDQLPRPNPQDLPIPRRLRSASPLALRTRSTSPSGEVLYGTGRHGGKSGISVRISGNDHIRVFDRNGSPTPTSTSQQFEYTRRVDRSPEMVDQVIGQHALEGLESSNWNGNGAVYQEMFSGSSRLTRPPAPVAQSVPSRSWEARQDIRKIREDRASVMRGSGVVLEADPTDPIPVGRFGHRRQRSASYPPRPDPSLFAPPPLKRDARYDATYHPKPAMMNEPPFQRRRTSQSAVAGQYFGSAANPSTDSRLIRAPIPTAAMAQGSQRPPFHVGETFPTGPRVLQQQGRDAGGRAAYRPF